MTETRVIRCSICGYEFAPRIYKNGRPDYRCKRCEAMRQRRARKNGRSPQALYTEAKSIARRVEKPWTVTFDEYVELRSKSCDYCGFPLPRTGTALDRLDYRRGYTLDNVVPCCTDCNLARNANFTYEEMKVLGRCIRRIKRARKNGGENPVRKPGGIGRPRKYGEELPDRPDRRRHRPISDEVVRQIRHAREVLHLTYPQMRTRFGLCNHTLWGIVTRKSHKDVV